MVWVLVIYSAGLNYPITAYQSEAECEKARAEWVTEPGWDTICMPGIMEKEKRRKRR
jgi:hypothetical protein